MKKKALNLIKLLAGILILVYILFYKTNPAQIIEVLKSASVPLVILSLSLHSIGIYVSALRWKLILNEKNGGYSTWDLSKSYLVSNFFNLFLSRFGGDVIRISDTRNTEKGLAKSTAVVLVERLSGVFVLVIFAISAAIIKFDFVKDIPQIIYPIALAVAGLVVFFIVWKVLPGDFFTRFNFSNSFINKIFSKFAKLHASILDALSNRSILIKATGYSIILQLNVIIHFYLIGLSLNLEIPLIAYFYIIPIVLLVLSFPITPPNGLGLKEFILAELFAAYSYSYPHAVSFSLIDIMGLIILGIIGSIIFFSRKK